MKRILLALMICFAAMPAFAEGERFVLISHAPDSDSWWNTIKNAIRDAGAQVGATVEYRNPPSGDIADMIRITEQVAASNPDGVIITIADFNALKKAVAKITRKGIPVITINSGTAEESAKLGALMHIGQPEHTAGLEAGKRAVKEAGVKHFVCVNHYITNPASVERCQGFADAIDGKLKGKMIDAGNDPSGIENAVLAYLRAHPETDAVLTLGPPPASSTLRALEKNKMAGKLYFATFDLSEEIARGIKDGKINFAIDQQPYLQGYLPVILLTNYVRYGVIPSGNINSGPGFITKDSVERVEKLSGEYR